MFDFRLQVFRAVAKRLNFTRASEELFISQPAVTKHIRETERHFKTKLFERSGSKIALTPAGELLLQHTEELFALYRKMELELSSFTQHHKGKLRVGASTTIAEYLLPPALAAFKKSFKDVSVVLSGGNTEHIEQLLQKNEIDFGMIEGQPKSGLFKYTPFIKDEIVLVAAAKNPIAKKQQISLKELQVIPLALREPGSGTLEVIAKHLKSRHIRLSQLNREIQLESSESIKSYIAHSQAASFLSIHTILKELNSGELVIIDVQGLEIERHFQFVQLQSGAAAIPGFFIKFINHYYNFKQ
ncbi:transcriptional regulator [Niabella ginsenosidivorans]|uniref:Transcriptional regulator n=1 Tax=Niabella ginsenosidivorans TaxID=1176587 RepID=A0A1A9I289_9BACT|nr:LysR family transcriptional regulator [Niabella ginsenosidivorans]ANH80802.1 transcriptional regulator [Niabella ginsenosidivorans]